MQTLGKTCICQLGIFLSFALFFFFVFSSCLVHAVDTKKEQEMITVTGKIRLVGNEPFTHVVITSDDGKDNRVQGDHERALRSLQYQRVTAHGIHLEASGQFKDTIEVTEYTIVNPAH